MRSDRSHLSACPITSRFTAISPTRFSSRVSRPNPPINPDFRFDCGTFAHPSSRHALICSGSARGTPPEWLGDDRLQAEAFVQLADQNQAGVRRDARSLKRDLQKSVEHELKRLGCFLTHRVLSASAAREWRDSVGHAGIVEYLSPVAGRRRIGEHPGGSCQAVSRCAGLMLLPAPRAVSRIHFRFQFGEVGFREGDTRR
jgi:hypothetical protein